MDIIREPDGVDFVVEPTKLTKADKELISKVLAHYKATGEKLVIEPTKTKPKSTKSKKELITRP